MRQEQVTSPAVEKWRKDDCKMLFEAGDIFEVSGARCYKVIIATADFFICCPIVQRVDRTKEPYEAIPVVDINQPQTFSNEGSLEEFYWIKKIDAYDCINAESDGVQKINRMEK
jgi:hypothetical protein